MALPGSDKRLTVLIVILLIAVVAWGQQGAVAEGDLAFVVNREGNAITEVTHGIDGLPIEHVAIMHRIGGDNGPLYVIEAIGRGVCLTPIDTFLCSNGACNVVLGRVEDLDARQSVRKALSYIGVPYDYYFMPDDSAMYCSELVQKCYVDKAGAHVFQPIAMSFHDAQGHITDYWRQHYAAQGLDVPDGAPGSNPGDLSRSKRVRILPVSLE